MPTLSHGILAHIGGIVAPPEFYHFRANTGSATLTGIFIDAQSRQVGVSFTATVTTSATSILKDLLSPWPKNAVGFIGRVQTNTVSFALLDKDHYEYPAQLADFGTNQTRYPVLATSDKVTLANVP